MANDLLNPPEIERGGPSHNGTSLNSGNPTETGHELNALLGKAFEEKSVFADLFENVHDLFFPQKLPPLELTSTPIPVADPMAVKRSPVSIAISTVINLGILAILLFAFRKQIVAVIPPKMLSNIDVQISRRGCRRRLKNPATWAAAVAVVRMISLPGR